MNAAVPLPPRDRLTDGLNDRQREAVTAPVGHRLVVAGPGSGKTRVLTHRIAWLIDRERIRPSSILAVTFTRKAANEIHKRLHDLTGELPSVPTTGTFHSISVRWLHRFADEAGLRPDFTILDADDQRKILRTLLKGHRGDNPSPVTPAEVQDWITHQKEAGHRWAAVESQPGETAELLRALYRDYERYCAEHGVVDFSELILRCVELLRTDGPLRAYVRSRYRHLLVDEFQDTNAIQHEWVRLVLGERAKLFAVGDDDQAIYGWRGADSGHMLSLPDTLNGIAVTRLERNYRSTGHVVTAAHALIAHNALRFDKKLWTSAEDGTRITICGARNEDDEAEFIADRARQYIADGGSPGDIAVLYRANYVSTAVEQALLRHRLPYAIRHGHAFLERAEIKDAMAWLRLLSDPGDNMAFARASQTPPCHIGKATLRKIADAPANTSWRAVGATLKPAACAAIEVFADRLDTLHDHIADLPVPEQVRIAINGSGLRAYYAKDGEHRTDNFDQLARIATAYAHSQDTGTPTLAGFLEYLVLEADSEDSDKSEPKIQLLTLHAAKGLEFPVVFMAAVEAGILPDHRAGDRPHGLEEERRLAYVGMTRARDHLILSWAKRRAFHGRSLPAEPSPFLAELPVANIEALGLARARHEDFAALDKVA
ncbi:MAG TPA: UvrD-helicase domain-containing protein [Rhodanobacteraceae bacterium]